MNTVLADLAPEVAQLRATLERYGDRLDLVVSKKWIDARPLLRSDLVGEPEDMQGLCVAFKPFAA